MVIFIIETKYFGTVVLSMDFDFVENSIPACRSEVSIRMHDDGLVSMEDIEGFSTYPLKDYIEFLKPAVRQKFIAVSREFEHIHGKKNRQ